MVDLEKRQTVALITALALAAAFILAYMISGAVSGGGTFPVPAE